MSRPNWKGLMSGKTTRAIEMKNQFNQLTETESFKYQIFRQLINFHSIWYQPTQIFKKFARPIPRMYVSTFNFFCPSYTALSAMLLDWNLLGDAILSKSGYLGFCVLSTHCQTPWGWLFANPIIQLLLSIFIQENIYLTFWLRARQALCKYTDCGFLKFKSQMVGHRLLLLKLLCNMIFDKERLVK